MCTDVKKRAAQTVSTVARFKYRQSSAGTVKKYNPIRASERLPDKPSRSAAAPRKPPASSQGTATTARTYKPGVARRRLYCNPALTQVARTHEGTPVDIPAKITVSQSRAITWTAPEHITPVAMVKRTSKKKKKKRRLISAFHHHKRSRPKSAKQKLPATCQPFSGAIRGHHPNANCPTVVSVITRERKDREGERGRHGPPRPVCKTRQKKITFVI